MMQIIVILWGTHALFIPSFCSIREKNGWYQDDSSSVIDVSSSFFQISGRKIFRRTNYIHTILNFTLFMKINTVHCTCICYSTVNSLAIFYSIYHVNTNFVGQVMHNSTRLVEHRSNIKIIQISTQQKRVSHNRQPWTQTLRFFVYPKYVYMVVE